MTLFRRIVHPTDFSKASGPGARVSRGLLLGSVALRVLALAPRPVLIVHGPR